MRATRGYLLHRLEVFENLLAGYQRSKNNVMETASLMVIDELTTVLYILDSEIMEAQRVPEMEAEHERGGTSDAE